MPEIIHILERAGTPADALGQLFGACRVRQRLQLRGEEPLPLGDWHDHTRPSKLD